MNVSKGMAVRHRMIHLRTIILTYFYNNTLGRHSSVPRKADPLAVRHRSIATQLLKGHVNMPKMSSWQKNGDALTGINPNIIGFWNKVPILRPADRKDSTNLIDLDA
jgi:hypothetical protein